MKNIFVSVIAAMFILFAIPAMADSDADAVSDADITQGPINSYNTSIAAPIPGGAAYGPAINYFGKPLPSEGFQPVETILMYVCWFSDGALDSILKGFDDAEAELEIADLTYNDAPTRRENGDTRYIKIGLCYCQVRWPKCNYG